MKRESRERKGLNNRGISLVEVIISITILAVVTLPVLHTLVMSARYNGKARERQRVTTSAESIMESFKAYELQEIYAQFQDGSFRGCALPLEGGGVLKVQRVDASGNDIGVTIESDGKLTDISADEAYVYSIANLINESQRYDARVTVKAVPDKINMNVIELKDFNPYRDAIIKSIGATSDFSEVIKKDFKDNDYVDAFLNELNDKDKSAVVFTEDNIDYTYLSVVARTIQLSLYENCGNAVVSYRINVRYKVKEYPYQLVAGDTTSILTLDTTEYSVEVEGETQAYNNPKDKLDRVFFYYYPVYYAGEDSIEITNSLTNSVDMYVVKQIMPSVNMAILQTQEASYTGRVSYSGSGSVKLYHNFNENLSGNSSTPSPQIVGIAAEKVSPLNATNFMQVQQTLMYDVTVEIFEEGQAALGFTDSPIARLEGTTNE